MTPHTSPLWASYGVSFMSYTKKNDFAIARAQCDITAAHHPQSLMDRDGLHLTFQAHFLEFKNSKCISFHAI